MKKIKLLSLALGLAFYTQAQQLNKALSLFADNKREEASQLLSGISSGNDKAYALLAQCLIEADNGHYLEAFRRMRDFTQLYENPYPYIYAMSSSGIFTLEECSNSTEVKKFWENVLNDPKANETIKSLAAERLGTMAINKNNFKEANKYFASLKDVSNWSTVGVFDNTSGSGFNKDYGVPAHPEESYEFKNMNGAAVKWFSIPVARNDRWWDLQFHYDISNALIYVQTFIESDADKEVLLLTGVSGSMKIWLNDYLVATEAEERNTDNDVYNYKVKLQKGINRLLIQLGSSEINNNNYMVRIADLNGSLLQLPSGAMLKPYTKAVPYTVEKIPFFAEQYFENKLKADPDNLIDLIMLSNVYNHNDKKHEARTIAAKMKKLAPQSTIVAERVIETLNRDNNALDATKEMESVKKNDPESLYGLMLRYDETENKEDWNEAESLLNRWVALYGSDAETDIKRLNIYNKKNETGKVLEAVNNGYKKWPDNVTFAVYKYFIALNSDKNLRKANDILKEYLKGNYNDKIQDQVTDNYFKLGEKQTALKMYKQQIENYPYAIMNYANLASVYYDLHEYDEALEWQQKALDRAPYVGKFYYSKGLIYESKNNTALAKEMMRKAIYYAPANYDARKKLRQLEGKKDLFSQFKANDVQAIYKDALAKNEYPDDDAVFLLQDQSQIVYPENGATEEKHEVLIQVLTQTGINDYKELSIPYNGYTQRLVLEKAELFKKDGSSVMAENNDNELVFSTLEKGDAIHLSYKLESAYYGKLAEHFWEEVQLNGGNPVKTARYSLIVPGNRQFKYKVYNTDLKPEEKGIDDYKMYVWEKKDIPAVKSEPYMPPASDIAERIVVTSIPDWSYVANWYSDLSNVKTKADYVIKEKVNELFEGKKNLTDIEKARIIYEYIEHNYNYSDVPFLHSAFVPQTASRTLTAKLGDCKDLATLFVSMGREVGLDVNLVLVDTRDNGKESLDLPMIGFNHCIAQLHDKNKNYLIELTNNNLPFSTLSYQLLNANSLYIPKDGNHIQNAALTKLNTDNRPENSIVRASILDFAGASGQTKLHRIAWRTGDEAALMRGAYKDVTTEQRNKNLTASLSEEFNKNIQIQSFDVTNVENLRDTMLFDYLFTIDNYTSDIAGMQVFKLPWADAATTQGLVSMEKRQYPLDIWSLYATPVMKETITVNFPAGKKLVEVPKNINLRCDAVNYDLKYEMKNNQLMATRTITYLKDRVNPEEYTVFKNFVTQMNEADAKQYAFK